MASQQLGKRMLRAGLNRPKVCLITGGSSGIGRSSCVELAREGAQVIVSDLPSQEKGGQEVVEEITKFGGQAKFIPLNVSDEKQWQDAIADTEKTFGPIDVVFNNAGVGAPEPPLEELPLDRWRQTMSVNLDGVFLGTKYGIQSMKRNQDIVQSNNKQPFSVGKTSGSIINCSSILGLVGFGRSSTYSSTKGGVRLLTKSTALYCAENKLSIRANSIHPAFVETGLTTIFQGPVRDYVASLHPVGRWGVPKEIAMGVLFLASDEASFVTGSELVLDGGYTCK